jgi:hypothetical protein
MRGIIHLVAICGLALFHSPVGLADQSTQKGAGCAISTKDPLRHGLFRPVAMNNADTDALRFKPAPPDHIVVVVEENHGFSQIIGNRDAAYINFLAGTGMLFTNYHAVGHPSEPNYFALFSGSTQGVRGDGVTYFPNTPTLAGELQQAGYSFVGYAEPPVDRDHSPWMSFGDARSLGQAFSQFPTDYNRLPTVSFVSPNLQHDMHDGGVVEGDLWLSTNLSPYAKWAKTHNSLLVVTFDEDQGTTNNRVPTIVFGEGVAAGEDKQPLDHYALLHTIEILYGLQPLAATAGAGVMNFRPAR